MKSTSTSGSLRRRLAALLAAFALFAVVSAAATIYGVQWHIDRALDEFELTMGQVVEADRIHVGLKEQAILLRELLNGRTEVVDSYFVVRDGFQAQLRHIINYSPPAPRHAGWRDVLNLAQQVADESDRCLVALNLGRTEDARAYFAESIDAKLLPQLETHILGLKAVLDEARNRSTKDLAGASSLVLIVTFAVGVLAAGLVILGVTLIRRWLITPVQSLQRAVVRFGAGDLAHRVVTSRDDELGQLGKTLNAMAASLEEASQKLSASETKYRSLFQNLRDAVVLCDAAGQIVEHHDGDTRLLGADHGEHVGRRPSDVWPELRKAHADFEAVLNDAVGSGRHFRAADIEWRLGARGDIVWTDVLVYPVEYGGTRHAAIVVRDVSERMRFQRKLHQAETMQAVGTLAGGLAHDFNNLLAGVIGTLSLLETELTDAQQADRLRTVVRTCWQAVGLSRRLLNFASSAHGEPQGFRVAEAVDVVLDSMDPSFLEGVDLIRNIDPDVGVRMDRDHFTQIVMNLLRNAREAMPDGGTLRVEVAKAVQTDPDDPHRERPYAVVTVADTGVGMSRDVQSRIFEPFFTTKSRASGRGRGMGMAITYSAVRNAGGFLLVDSEPGHGTAMRVHLPYCEPGLEPVPAKRPPESGARGGGMVLVVEENQVVRDVAATALRQRGYAVLAADGAADARSKVHALDKRQLMLAVIDEKLSDGDACALAETIVVDHPDAGLIFTTAGIPQPLPQSLADRTRARLPKPYALEELAAAVAAAAAARTAPT
ncbi:MAG: ATP-binding protein [Planctomycetota bacterium]